MYQFFIVIFAFLTIFAIKYYFMNFNKCLYSLGLCFTIFVISCSTKKQVPSVVKAPELPKNFSTDLIINYRIDKSGLKDTFNNAISEVFKGNFDLPEYDVKLTLSKPRPASVEIEGKSVLVVVPITVNVLKKTFLADLTAKGTLEMSFVTDLDIDSLWNMKTSTKLGYHRWIEKPKLSIVGLNLPIESISDAAINRSKSVIESSIDESVRESFTLKAKMKETLAIFANPIQVSPDLNAWLSIKPEKFQINKVLNSKMVASGKIHINALSSFTTYKPAPTPPQNTLPKVYWNENLPDSSVFRIVADIKMADINPILKANLDGKTFTEGDKSITLSNLITNCDYEFLRVVTDVAGTVNGQLIISGKPKYNHDTNTFYMDNIDIKLRTKNVLHKAAAWLGEGKIRHELENKMKFSINETLATVQKNIDTQLKKLNNDYNLEMKVGIGSAEVEKFELKPGQILATLKTKFYLDMLIRDFRSFNKF